MLTCFSAVLAEIVSHPIDIIKTRLQYFETESFGNSTSVENISDEDISDEDISDEEELKPLVNSKNINVNTPINFRSVLPAASRHAVYTPLRIFLYANTRSKNSSLFVKIFSGMFSGAFAQFAVTPIEVIKVHLQVNNENSVGCTTTIKNIWKTHGVGGFYSGSIPSVLKSTVTNLVELVTYDTVKIYLSSYIMNAFRLHCTAVTITSLFVTFFATPIDVLKTRQMMESAPICVHVQNILAKNVFLFWSGAFYYWCREMVWLCLFWLTYEYGRQRIGLNEF